jgi:hypothetical protein
MGEHYETLREEGKSKMVLSEMVSLGLPNNALRSAKELRCHELTEFTSLEFILAEGASCSTASAQWIACAQFLIPEAAGLSGQRVRRYDPRRR